MLRREHWAVWCAAAAAVLIAGQATGSRHTFQCKGERIEKGTSTWGYARSTGSDFRIETTSSTVGWVIKRNDKWAIESSGRSTLAWLTGDRIEKSNGSTWTRIDTARDFAKCEDAVAAGLWVLQQKGKLP